MKGWEEWLPPLPPVQHFEGQLHLEGTMPNKCQHVECSDDADFEIFDPADMHEGTATVFSCTAHVGELLGHALHVTDDAPDLWEIRPCE